MPQPNGKRTTEASQQVVLAALPCTQKEIQTALNLRQEQVRRIVNRMRAAGQVHVGGYRSGKGGPLASIYHAGPSVDAVRPPSPTRQEVNQLYKRRSRARAVAASVAMGGQAKAVRLFLDAPSKTRHLQGIWA